MTKTVIKLFKKLRKHQLRKHQNVKRTTSKISELNNLLNKGLLHDYS